MADFPQDAPKIIRLQLSDEMYERIGGTPLDPSIDKGNYSIGENISFPAENGRMVHAIYYPPKNRDFIFPKDLKPPLLVSAHRGPTAQSFRSFSNIGQAGASPSLMSIIPQHRLWEILP